MDFSSFVLYSDVYILVVGVCNRIVECSISPHFFQHYPTILHNICLPNCRDRSGVVFSRYGFNDVLGGIVNVV